MPAGDLPRGLKVEVKFTRSDSISLPERELKALSSSDAGVVGVIAALFWCGKSTDGKWLLANAADPLVARPTALTPKSLERLIRSQQSLASLRDCLDELWPRFLAAFKDSAKQGHRSLVRRLQAVFDQGDWEQALPRHTILEFEHRDNMRDLLAHLGPSKAGRIMQSLFAYLLRAAGYQTVTTNPIGVPDVFASDPRQQSGIVEVRLTVEEARRVLRYCKDAGDAQLTRRIARQDERLDLPQIV